MKNKFNIGDIVYVANMHGFGLRVSVILEIRISSEGISYQNGIGHGTTYDNENIIFKTLEECVDFLKERAKKEYLENLEKCENLFEEKFDLDIEEATKFKEQWRKDQWKIYTHQSTTY